MIQYNWHKVFRATGGNSLEILRVIKMLTYSEIVVNKYDKLKKYENFDFKSNPTSFLVNPELLYEAQNSFRSGELARYIALASCRSLADYLAFKTVTLSLYHSPVSLDVIGDINNKLLFIQDNQVHFVFEELRRK